MITKKCDYCGKFIEIKGNADYPYSEWCVYHFKKRRDFCCGECMKKWVAKYFDDKETNESLSLSNDVKWVGDVNKYNFPENQEVVLVEDAKEKIQNAQKRLEKYMDEKCKIIDGFPITQLFKIFKEEFGGKFIK